MLVKIPAGPRRYDRARYWGFAIARASVCDGNLRMQYGCWVSGPRRKGMLVVKASPGDVVAVGYRAYSGEDKWNRWYLVLPDGSVQKVSRIDAISRLAGLNG